MQAENDQVVANLGFSLYSSSALQWKIIVTIIQCLSEDATFEVDGDGVRFRGMDPSHVALTDIKLPPSSFQRFQYSRQTRFTVHVEDFAKLIKRSDSQEEIAISSTPDGLLSIRTRSGSYDREFELHLQNSELKSPPIPKLSFSTRFLMGLDSFREILNDISAVSNHIQIRAAKDSLKFCGKGDSANAQVLLRADNNEYLLEHFGDNDSETAATYSLEYLMKIVKSIASATDSVAIEFSNKMPLRLQFKLGNAENFSLIQFYLAPRVTD